MNLKDKRQWIFIILILLVFSSIGLVYRRNLEIEKIKTECIEKEDIWIDSKSCCCPFFVLFQSSQ